MKERLKRLVRIGVINKTGVELPGEVLDSIVDVVGSEYYLEGFKASAEGFNGEYPFADKGKSDEEIWRAILPSYEELNNEPKADF